MRVASPQTVAAPPPAAAPEGAATDGADAAADHLRTFFDAISHNWQAWLLALGIMAAAVILAIVLHLLAFGVLTRAARRTSWTIDEILITRLRKPARFILPLLAVQLTFPLLANVMPAGTNIDPLRHIVSILLIAAGTWLLIALVSAGEAFVRSRHDITVADNLEARRIYTQLRVVRRTLSIFIFVIGAAAILMTFPGVRQFGASLLASAGLAGLVVGLAARPAVENIIAGLQIALTQPIRLDDVVTMEGEFGRIEEITATYVVVKIWDERRLIVPFSKIITEPFQNWTYATADSLGTVFLHCDYTVDVQKVREELDRIVKGPPPAEPAGDRPSAPHPKWDGRVCSLIVNEARERTLELRVLVSASDSGKSFDLRCDIREKLIAFIQREYPGSLPRVRAEIEQPSTARGAAAKGSEP